MAKYRKTIVVEATQWFKDGDHPAVKTLKFVDCYYCGEGQTDHGAVPIAQCMECGGPEGMKVLCPGNWLIEHGQGKFDTCRREVFEKTCELVDEDS